MLHRRDAFLLAQVVVCLLACVAGCSRRVPETDPTPATAAELQAAEQPSAGKGDETMGFALTSTAFSNGERIPVKHTADGEDLSPPLSWADAPEGTVEFALICDDPDAPVGTWNHWVLYGLAADVVALPEGLPKTATVADPACKQGLNTWPKLGYWGPAPPRGKPHRYQFTLYALSAGLELAPEATKEKLLAAMEGKVLGQATVEGVYSR